MEFVVRPIEKWPRAETPANKRQGGGTFRAGYQDTWDHLWKELRHLNAKNVVLQADFAEHEIRNDGQPRATARPRTPRVALFFDSKFGPLTYYCDDCIHWEHNVRAIALTLERLRLAELYGVTKRGEQYTGFRALPSGIPMGPVMTLEDAARTIAQMLGMPDYWQPMIGAIDTFKGLNRQGSMKFHPDRGGSVDDWNRFQKAAEMLKKHHGVA